MKMAVKQAIGTAIGVALAGLIMYYGGALPVISDARKGFGGQTR